MIHSVAPASHICITHSTLFSSCISCHHMSKRGHFGQTVSMESADFSQFPLFSRKLGLFPFNSVRDQVNQSREHVLIKIFILILMEGGGAQNLQKRTFLTWFQQISQISFYFCGISFYPECRISFIVVLNVIMVSVVMLIVVKLSVVKPHKKSAIANALAYFAFSTKRAVTSTQRKRKLVFAEKELGQLSLASLSSLV